MISNLLSSIHNLLPVWTVSRAAGITAYLLLFVSVVTGMSAHYHFLSPGTKAAMNLIHQSTGWFGILFGMTHGLILVYSTYQSFSIWNVLVPFTSKTNPFLIGIGVLSLYVMILLVVTSDAMKKLGWKTWKAIHFLAFPAFLGAFLHSVLLGPDTQYPSIKWLYLSTGVITAAALICRIVIRTPKRKMAGRRLPDAGHQGAK
jgi:Predicted ferric reductase